MSAALPTCLLLAWTLLQVPQREAPSPRFQIMEGPRASVAYGPGDSLRAVMVVRFLGEQPKLPGLPSDLPQATTIYLAPDESAFDSLTGGYVPEWSAGVAIPGEGVVVLPPYGSERIQGWNERRVLRHEWAHLGLGQYLEGLRIPRWFQEGYAEWASGGWNAAEGWRLRIAFATGRAHSLDSLSLSWPRDRASAELAYMLSATAVEYLVYASGERGLELFLSAWREAGSFDRAIRRVYGVTQGQFEEDWRGYVKNRYGWFLVVTHSLVFWLFLTLVLLVMVWIRRRRNRLAMARLRATEPPERPAYWSGTEAGAEEEVDGGTIRANED